MQHPRLPFLVSAQSEESLCWAAEHDIPFAQIDATVEQARHETVTNAILRLSSQLDLMGLAMIFKLGAMPYDMVERSNDHLRRRGGAEDPPCSRPRYRRQPHDRNTGTTH